jgi:hypothetical protein
MCFSIASVATLLLRAKSSTVDEVLSARSLLECGNTRGLRDSGKLVSSWQVPAHELVSLLWRRCQGPNARESLGVGIGPYDLAGVRRPCLFQIATSCDASLELEIRGLLLVSCFSPSTGFYSTYHPSVPAPFSSSGRLSRTPTLRARSMVLGHGYV